MLRHIDPQSARGRALARELGVEWSPEATGPVSAALAHEFARSVPYGEHPLRTLIGIVAPRFRDDIHRCLARCVELGLLQATLHGKVRLVRRIRPQQRRCRPEKACRREMADEVLRLTAGSRWYTVDMMVEALGYTRAQLDKPVRGLYRAGALCRRRRDNRTWEYRNGRHTDAASASS